MGPQLEQMGSLIFMLNIFHKNLCTAFIHSFMYSDIFVNKGLDYRENIKR